MALNKLLDSGTRSLTILCIELGSRNAKLITVAILSPLTILTSYYYCMWMICLLQGLTLIINNLKKQLSKQFVMKDLEVAKQILGMRIIRDKANGTLKLSQS